MDYLQLFGYLYWLTGSRATALDVGRSAWRLQQMDTEVRGKAEPDALWGAATQLAAALPEDRRRPGWMPLGKGPAAPPLLAGLAALPVPERAAVLLRYGLGWDEGRAAEVTSAAPDRALSGLAQAFEGDAERTRAEVRRLAWPRPTPGDISFITTPIAWEDEPGAPSKPAPRSRLVHAAERAAIILAVVVIGWLAWRNLTGSGREAPAPDVMLTPAPAATVEATAVPTATPFPPITDPNVPVGAVEWLRSNATRISGASLRGVVGDARIVVIGDGTWGASGAAEYHRERLHLTRHLVDDLGFDMLILQAPEPASYIANLFMQSTGGGFEALARALAGPWATRELATALEWMRERQDVAVAGFLPPREYSQRLLRNVEMYLRQVDPQNARRVSDDSRVLLAYLEARRDVYEPQDASGYRRALNDARSQVQYDALATAGDQGDAGGLYEQFARENLARLLEEAGDRRVIIWAEDMAASGLPALQNVAALVPETPDRPIVRLGFLFGEGSLYALRTPVSRRAQQMIVQQVEAPPSGAHERILWSSGIPTTSRSGFLANLRATLSSGEGWPAEVRPLRRSTGAYNECFPEEYFEQVALSDKYDAVVYMQQVTPVTLLEKPPVAFAGPCLHAPQNLDFSRSRSGWERGGTAPAQYRVGSDAELRRGYVRALDGSPDGTGTLYQSFRGDGYAGRTVRLAGRCFVDSERANAQLFMEARGMGGEVLAEQRGALSRERRFPPCEVALTIPEGTTRIDMGLLVDGRGEAWLGAVTFGVE
jgi:erythromycin esterase-like protein